MIHARFPRRRDVPVAGPRNRPPETACPPPAEWELARLRREMPQIGFLYDGRSWWGVYGCLVIMYASDLGLLREHIPQAVRTARHGTATNTGRSRR